MYIELNMPIIRTVCPDTMEKANCPVYQYLENKHTLFRVSMNETHLIPNSYNSIKLACAINKMRAICRKCGKKANETTR